MERSIDPKIVALREEMLSKIAAAQKAAHAYWTECDVGPDRTRGAEIYGNLMRATRVS